VPLCLCAFAPLCLCLRDLSFDTARGTDLRGSCLYTLPFGRPPRVELSAAEARHRKAPHEEVLPRRAAVALVDGKGQCVGLPVDGLLVEEETKVGAAITLGLRCSAWIDKGWKECISLCVCVLYVLYVLYVCMYVCVVCVRCVCVCCMCVVSAGGGAAPP
jgi:hypothetical protein